MPSPTTLKSTKPMLSSTHRSSPRKARIARGRRRANGFHSDDEIEREARSDSDSDEDDQTSVDSDTDSETGPPSEDTPHDGHPTLLSPSTTPPAIDGSKDGDDHAPLLAAAVTWSDVVADEMANGTSELPVIDFADLDANVINATTPPAPVHRRAPKSKRPAPHRHSSEPAVAIASSGPSPEPPIAPASPKEPTSHPEPKPATPPAPHRRGRAARQAYQDRLENDPSYVPTLGEFWGHDDRLLDKDLRGFSPWWRKRWQGGPRGRGFGFRGRGQGRDRGDTNAGNDGHSNGEVPPSPLADVPPVDRQWKHDGFEELKRRDEQRLQRQDQSQGSSGNNRGPRGGFSSRGRGFGRGRFSPCPGTTRSSDSPDSMTHRPWFVIRPERPWTKHHEVFLYLDPSARPRPGQGPAYRVKLSGTRPEVIVQTSAQPSPPRAPTPPRDVGNEDGEHLVFTVSLPRGDRRPEVTESAPTPTAVIAPLSPIPTSSPEQVSDEASVSVPPPRSPTIAASTTRPASPPVLRIVTEEQAEATCEPVDDPFKLRNPPPPTVIPLATPTPAPINSTTSTSSAVSPSVPAPISQSTSVPEGGLLWRSPPPHLQSTLMQPVPVSAPSYTSTYSYAPVSAPALPPGVALDAHGMPYELSTGRPLYLAAPPPQVHTPVYMMPYTHMQSHVQHRPHASPDPSLFAPARQGSRIEIRRPDVPSAPEDSRLASTQTQTHTSRPSALRASASAPAFIPSHAAALAPHEFYPSPPPEVASAPGQAAVMGYAAYPQPPYYAYGGPEGYAYPPPPPQFVEYDAYNADPRVGGSAATQAAYY